VRADLVRVILLQEVKAVPSHATSGAFTSAPGSTVKRSFGTGERQSASR
jgi:hypothetical protein